MRSIEFAIGLFDDPGLLGIAADDLDGLHGLLLRSWQEQGFISREPGLHPCPGCPHCFEGSPYRIGNRVLCNVCRSSVDPRHLLLWPLHREALLAHIASNLGLHGGLRMVDASLWQLGTGDVEGEAVECFSYSHGFLSEQGQRRLAAYRRVLVLHGPSVKPGQPGRWVPLLELFAPDGSLVKANLGTLLRPRGAVRFEEHSGALWLGGTCLGEVPVGSKEYHFLACLWEQRDQFVPYADLKREVLRRSANHDETEEATFCHGLKRRIKKRSIVDIDNLIVTTNKADGYRLRGWWSEPCQK